MGYYVRAFCRIAGQPSVGMLMEWLREGGSRAVIESPDADPWTQLLVQYKAGRNPILVEWSEDDSVDTDTTPVREEVAEFLEELGAAWWSIRKRRVVDHLRKTRAVVACQLPSDIDDDGYETNQRLLQFFVQHRGGLVFADGEGFYDGDRLTLRME